MKKGLSVLLVAAALFGFYGGAVNLNDILACKDYWEEAGEKSTADMNKLEDGLNQLKDNEQAYLDGLDQVAQGEKDLAQGEADYAAGQAELAKGEADYAAAPGKLADARKQIAEGEDQLADGKKSLDGLKQLIAGINTILKGYPQWKSGLEQLQTARSKQLTPAVKAQYADLVLMSNFAGEQAESFKDAVDGINEDDGSASIDDFAKYTNDINAALPTINGNVAALSGALESLIPLSTTSSAKDYAGAAKFCGAVANNVSGARTGLAGINNAVAALTQAESGPFTQFLANAGKLYTVLTSEDTSEEGMAAKDAAVGSVIRVNQGLKSVSSNYGEKLQAALAGSSAEGLLATGTNTFNTGYASLAANQDALAGGVQKIAYNVLNNATLKSAVVKEMGAAAAAGLSMYTSEKTSPLFKANGGTSEMFARQMETMPNLIAVLTKARTLLTDAYNDGLKTYNAGQKKLAAGKKQYAKGLSDYKAAPGKLADGRQQLAEGLQALMDGRKQLADGKDQLAQYEDGEQQVRDGLATLVGTEADLDLKSILDRLNGDSDFDNGDKHLELDEGLAAVEVGRGYQAEDGVLITKEIMTRAIGTGGLLAAGVLAVLAAILSFMKKNKGAGVFAILSAVAGAFGAYEATQAGSYFSSIAGSTVGQSGMIAAGILAAVALVHSIAHFTAKKDAEA